jgi:GNAT superfamily N-acetyltransferase
LSAVPDLVVRPIPIELTRPLRQAVLRPHETLEYLASHEPDDAYAVGVFSDDQLVAVGFIGVEGQEPGAWRVRGMATASEARGRGAGGKVLAALLDHATSHGARRVWCSARLRARPFYERAGFAVVSEEYDVPQTGPHYVMELAPRRSARASR